MSGDLARNVAAHDRQTVEFWRSASAAAHAKAMVELSEYAEVMARQTGFGKQDGQPPSPFLPRAEPA